MLTAIFWCQLVLITLILIDRLIDLKHQHFAGAFFLALILNNSFKLLKQNYAQVVLKYNLC